MNKKPVMIRIDERIWQEMRVEAVRRQMTSGELVEDLWALAERLRALQPAPTRKSA